MNIFDILNETPVFRYRVTFVDFYGVARVVVLEVKEKKDFREVLKKYREEHKDLYFKFYEEI